MKPTQIHTVVFSPTGTSKKIAQAIAQGLGGATAAIDCTHAAAEATLPGSDAAVFAVPVYGGKVAPTALKRMEGLHGTGTPAVVVVVYGNRDIGGAAAQLAAFVAERGFIPVAAAAFVGEHSYSTATDPIAAGRPDAGDLAAAVAFGAAVGEKLGRIGSADKTADAAVDAARLKAPRTPVWPLLRFIRFVLRYRKEQKRNPVVFLPVTDAGLCTHCGACAAVCPVEAIARGTEECTDPAHCIRCCACVKRCPVQARTYATPFSAALAHSFSRRKEPVTKL